ncbi:hypothetical protein GQ602_000200 [Ophiocordyceps camponoti-floridani]|uniref:Uncharacterized protein n=1 Tax=Ophiocordyceps camponoti-floridani TaxID=2030778 RepID=A0A8H4QBS9_9HYPO|nr:hypothetical protein GQ602_000200 [Ophiocordyceps camponoti-floridani]
MRLSPSYPALLVFIMLFVIAVSARQSPQSSLYSSSANADQDDPSNIVTDDEDHLMRCAARDCKSDAICHLRSGCSKCFFAKLNTGMGICV